MSNTKPKSNLVVKTHKLNTAIQNLSKPEIRIIQLAIVDARETCTGLSAEKPLRIDALRYAEVYDTTRQNAYARMKEAEETLFNRRFSYLDDEGKLVKSRWLSQVRYLDDEGAVEVIFTPAVVKGITRIDGAEDFFSSYLLEQTINLKSVYSIRLYELLNQWKVGKKPPPFELGKFRGQLGIVEEEYTEMCDLKNRVVDKAVNEINKETDLNVSYENVKKGRRIVGFQFLVAEKKVAKKEIEEEKTGDDSIDGLTDKQLKRIVLHKGFISTYGSLAKGDNGRDWKLFTKFMVNEIKKDPSKFSQKKPIREYLNGKDGDYEYY